MSRGSRYPASGGRPSSAATVGGRAQVLCSFLVGAGYSFIWLFFLPRETPSILLTSYLLLPPLDVSLGVCNLNVQRRRRTTTKNIRLRWSPPQSSRSRGAVLRGKRKHTTYRAFLMMNDDDDDDGDDDVDESVILSWPQCA
jgi:hypothetical protein